MEGDNKRSRSLLYGRGLQSEGSGLRSTSRAVTSANGVIYHDSNLAVSLFNDEGVNQNGIHGRFAEFNETRKVPLLPDTSLYCVRLVRAEVTTNNIPLFCPAPSRLITENNVSKWEVTAQPGLAMTWTGQPFLIQDSANGVLSSLNTNFAAWPEQGLIPFYQEPAFAVPAVPASPTISGVIDLSQYQRSPNVSLLTLLASLTQAFTDAGLNVTVAVATSGGSNIQYLTFVNNTLGTNLYLDFSAPVSDVLIGGGVIPPISRKGVLQAAKVFGFAPNSIFTLPGGAAPLQPPRQYQLPFCSVMNLYAYKTVRWVPEDKATGNYIPSVADVEKGTTLTYFDCYSYDHFLNQCINPTFQRCIYDQFDAPLPIAGQCLTRQLQQACLANCTGDAYSTTTSYAKGVGCNYLGRAYMWGGNTPALGISPVDSNNSSQFWIDCGESILLSWVPAYGYLPGDVVTYPVGNTYAVYEVSAAPPTVPVLTPPTDVASWTFISNILTTPSILGGGVLTNIPAIGTSAPVVSLDSAKMLFQLNLDTYGFGGTQLTNVDEGYGTVVADGYNPQTLAQQYYNASLNDQARDSWGATGYFPQAVLPYKNFRHPGATFDERFVVEADDYFHQLFGNWAALRLVYTDPTRKGLTTAYVRYLPQASAAGLTLPTPLPQFQESAAPVGAYLPYFRITAGQPYLYTFLQNYPSVGEMWNPVDTLVLLTADIPIVKDQVCPPNFETDAGTTTNAFSASNAAGGTFATQTQKEPNGQMERILAELVVKHGTYIGQQFRSEVIYEPSTEIWQNMDRSTVFNNVSWSLRMRMKQSQNLRQVSISDSGCVNVRLEFARRTDIIYE